MPEPTLQKQMARIILPSISVPTRAEFEKILKKVAPFVSMIHVDAADGIFSPTKFLDPEAVKELLLADMDVFLHMMLQDPESQLESWLALPQIKTAVFQIEPFVDSEINKIGEIVDNIHQAGRKAGVSLRLETPADLIEPFADKIDVVQFMAGEPGGYAAEYKTEVLQKIRAWHGKHPEIPVAIDIGVTPDHLPAMAEAGVSIFACGSYIKDSEDAGKAIEELRNV